VTIKLVKLIVVGSDSAYSMSIIPEMQFHYDSSSDKSRSVSLQSSSLSSRLSKLGGINNVLSSAGKILFGMKISIFSFQLSKMFWNLLYAILEKLSNFEFMLVLCVCVFFSQTIAGIFHLVAEK